MKKILVLLLIFGMASLANAAYIPLTLTMSAPATAEINTAFTVNVTLSGLTGSLQVNMLKDGQIVIGGTSTHTDGAITANANFDAGTNVLTYPDLQLNSGAPGPYVVNTDIVYSFGMTGTSLGNLTFGMDNKNAGVGELLLLGIDNGDWSYYGYPSLGPLTVVGGSTTVVPEPMTILLLGLGGLFLRRRK